MKEYLIAKDYDGEEINDINDDIIEALNNSEIPDEQGIIKGKIKIQVIWYSEDECDCIGFYHKKDCPRYIISS